MRLQTILLEVLASAMQKYSHKRKTLSNKETKLKKLLNVPKVRGSLSHSRCFQGMNQEQRPESRVEIFHFYFWLWPFIFEKKNVKII